jgi:hypothetical protein
MRDDQSHGRTSSTARAEVEERRGGTDDRLADVSQGLEGVDPQSDVLSVSDELEQQLNELWPLVLAELDDGDGRDDLSSDGTSSNGRGSEGLEDSLLDTAPEIDVE